MSTESEGKFQRIIAQEISSISITREPVFDKKRKTDNYLDLTNQSSRSVIMGILFRPLKAEIGFGD